MGYSNFSLLGEKIRKLRCGKKMSQHELGDGIVTRNMICRIECGKVKPSLDVLCSLAERLEMPVGYFLDDRDDGTEERRRKLYELILHEYSEKRYDSCLEYCNSYGTENAETVNIASECIYGIGMAYLNACETGKAQLMFGRILALAEKTSMELHELKKCRMLIVLIDEMKKDPGIAGLAGVCEAVVGQGSDDPFTRFCRYYLLLNEMPDAAEAVYMRYPFDDQVYSQIAKGLLKVKNGAYADAMAIFVGVLSDGVIPVCRMIILSELEKICVISKDFERAYLYSGMLREITDKIKKLDKKV